MPDARLQRTRETLPGGYQFGDSAPFDVAIQRLYARAKAAEWPIGEVLYVPLPRRWRAPHENNAEQLNRQQRTGDDTI